MSSTCHERRSRHQDSCHSRSVTGWQKNSISISSNSRRRKMKLPGEISLRKPLPICAMPNGTRCRELLSTLAKLTNMPCAVSGRSHTWAAASSTGPTNVLNIRLNCLASVSAPPHSGHPGAPARLHRCLLSHGASVYRERDAAPDLEGAKNVEGSQLPVEMLRELDLDDAFERAQRRRVEAQSPPELHLTCRSRAEHLDDADTALDGPRVARPACAAQEASAHGA